MCILNAKKRCNNLKYFFGVTESEKEGRAKRERESGEKGRQKVKRGIQREIEKGGGGERGIQ